MNNRTSVKSFPNCRVTTFTCEEPDEFGFGVDVETIEVWEPTTPAAVISTRFYYHAHNTEDFYCPVDEMYCEGDFSDIVTDHPDFVDPMAELAAEYMAEYRECRMSPSKRLHVALGMGYADEYGSY